MTERGLRAQLTTEEWSSRHQIAWDPGAQFTYIDKTWVQKYWVTCLWLDVLENIQHQCHFPASADQNSFREDTSLGLYVQVSLCLYLFCSLLLDGGILPSTWRGTVSCTDHCIGRHTEEPSNSHMLHLFFQVGKKTSPDCYCSGNADSSQGVGSGPAKPVKQV